MSIIGQIAYILTVFASGYILGTLHGDRARRRITQLLTDLQEELLAVKLDLVAERHKKPRTRKVAKRAKPRKVTKPTKPSAKSRKVKP